MPGAKNSVLKLMAASLLGDGTFEITNVPAIVDVSIMADLLIAIGVDVRLDETGIVTIINTGNLTPVAPFELVERIRASINVLGPLLTRCGHVRLALPGGDDFGTRPIDMHIAGLEAMGATFRIGDGYVEAFADRLHGAEITFDFPSVGATENLLTAAVFANGVTTIHNAAREPEIIDLCEFLNSMGAQISGAGTSTLVISGVERDALHACEHETVPDRIQAATYIAACAVSGGELDLLNAKPAHMAMALSRIRPTWVSSSRRSRTVCASRLPSDCAQPTWRRCLIPASRPTTSRSSSPCCRLPTGSRSSPRICIPAGSVTSMSWFGSALTFGSTGTMRSFGVCPDSLAPTSFRTTSGPARRWWWRDWRRKARPRSRGVHHIDRGYDDLVGRLRSVGAEITRYEG